MEKIVYNHAKGCQHLRASYIFLPLDKIQKNKRALKKSCGRDKKWAIFSAEHIGPPVLNAKISDRTNSIIPKRNIQVNN